MARFSLGGDEDGEGPSSRRPKRMRISVQSSALGRDDREQEGEHCEDEGQRETFEEEEEEEEESDYEEEEEEEDEEEEEEEEEEERFYDDEEEDNVVEENPGPTVTVGPRSNGGAQVGRDGSISVTLTDPEVLDCSICYEPLSSPVFQCENGHIACSSCCIKLRNKCPSCFWPIGYNRCRSIEKVLESVKISCSNAKYGCKEAVSYSKKSDHEKTCIYAPCSCPLSTCIFVASSKQLYIHFSRKHPISATCFLYGSMFSVTLNVNDKLLVLKEQNDGVLFVLNNSVEILGNLVRVYCIGPCSSTGGFPYTLLAKIQGSSLQLQSFTKNRQHCGDKPPSTGTGFLLIPSDFFGSSGQFKLDVCIQRNTVWFASARRMDPV